MTVEGKDLKVKLGTTKKEQQDAALKQVKEAHEDLKRAVKEIRHETQETTKKLEKILPQDTCKVFKVEVEKHFTKAETDAKKLIEGKEKEIKGA